MPFRKHGGVVTKNIGHRLGGTSPHTDNTIQSLQSTISRVEEPGFKYWEFDVHESADGILFVFHDDFIVNQGKNHLVRDLSFAQIIEFGSQIGVEIPPLTDVVSELEVRDEPVMIEIKNLMTDQARESIIDITNGRNGWNLMSSIGRFEKSFPDNLGYWKNRVESAGSKLVLIRRHDINLFDFCGNYLKWKLLKLKIRLTRK
ncbi:MAG: glycerophosphodiester phosphodiesterase family protein [Candidatus Thermoplasmatota archaeon]|nr:glycerophosphodiester phosphodiesterase family protein [Candidatus Thermoplasmatota archaeon]